MDNTERIQIQLALQELNNRFCYHLDRGQVDALIALFTVDADYTHGSRRLSGQQEIRAFFERHAAAPRTTRHMQTGLIIELKNARLALGRSVCLTFAAEASPPIKPADPFLVADYVDEYHCDEHGAWRIARRHIDRVFAGEANAGPIA